MKIFHFFLIICVFYFVKNENLICQEKSLISEFLNLNWKLNYEASNIPRSVKLGYKKINGNDFLIVNPGEIFNETDLIMKGAPDKRLILWGKSDDIGFVFYEEGGFSKHTCCLLYKLKKCKTLAIEVILFKSNIYTFNDLKTAIQSENYIRLGNKTY